MKSTRIVQTGTFSKLYPLTVKVGTIGKYHPSRKPTLKVTNSFHVGETARTFGVQSKHMIHSNVLSPAVKPKKS